ncbi:adenosylmethionine decarboxylase [Pseudonocardiaceae bacterium YIM PH 21723]|nr:adenosylmethionine decarboxylase [Pseudonocardiaceae bacterium YIM PH 21723]
MLTGQTLTTPQVVDVANEHEVGAFIGHHTLAEFHGVEPALLDDGPQLRDMLTGALAQSGATVCDIILKQFEPQGVTVLALLSESHASIHTYPERGSLFMDVFTCGTVAKPWLAVDLLAQAMGAADVRTNTVLRGDTHPCCQ